MVGVAGAAIVKLPVVALIAVLLASRTEMVCAPSERPDGWVNVNDVVVTLAPVGRAT